MYIIITAALCVLINGWMDNHGVEGGKLLPGRGGVRGKEGTGMGKGWERRKEERGKGR